MTYQTGPRIVTNGLVFCVDAADANSYAGSGTTWNDLSGNGNNGTLTNGPTFSSANRGSIVFDAVNDKITSNFSFSPNVTDGLSFSIIMSPDSNNTSWAQSYRYILGLSNSNNQHYGVLVEATTGKGIRMDVPNNIGTRYGYDTNTNITGGQTYFVCCTWANSIFNVYLSGRLTTTGTAVSYTPAPITSINIGCNHFGSDKFWGGNIYCVQIYNRALSATEVAQNYNATKGRYNL